MDNKEVYIEEAAGFDYSYLYSKCVAPSDFVLHNHKDKYELLIFLHGDASFRVEGAVYYPEPWDIVIANPNEMHKMCPASESEYERYVFNISESFFLKNDCTELKDFFVNRSLGANNLIKSDEAVKQILLRMTQCINDGAPGVVIKSQLIELLYHVRLNAEKTQLNLATQARIKDIIMYINENINSELALGTIAKKFYINKYHLCHTFRKHTGLSVNQYINYKRLLLARDLYAQGMSLTDASEEAGFNNYSCFYKMYKREFGVSPREDLKRG